jgi:ATP-dependent RNA helicase DDX35
LYLVETYPVTIVVGQTGSGKTTQLPQYLDQAGWCADGKSIAVTQVFPPLLHFFVVRPLGGEG